MMYPSVENEKMQSDNCYITRLELTSPACIVHGSLLHWCKYISWNMTQLWDFPVFESVEPFYIWEVNY